MIYKSKNLSPSIYPLSCKYCSAKDKSQLIIELIAMKLQRIILLFLICLFVSACGKDEDPIIETHKLDLTIFPENAGRVEVLSTSAKTNTIDFQKIEDGTTLTLKAIPNDGYGFAEWSGDIKSYDTELSFKIESNTQLSATFRSNEGTPVEAYGSLQIKDGKLVDSNNIPVQLRGMSLFWSQWISKYWNNDVVDWLANDWEINIIRAAMGVDESDGYLTNKYLEKQKVETVVDAAINKGIYVIIDWHSHHAENYQSEAIEFFEEMATKYGDHPNVIYEIYNEPLNVSWTGVIKPYAEAVIEAIRKIDNDNIIVVGTPNWSQNIDAVIGNEIESPNIAYSFHFYASEISHYQNLRNKVDVALSNNIPLFVTEWGVSEASGNGAFNLQWTNEWLEILEKNKISWCNWSVVDKSETSAALLPRANPKGQWNATELSASGTFIRNLLRSEKGYSNPE